MGGNEHGGGRKFRDGNVPALKDPLRVAQRAFATVPEGGPEGFIGFAVSARMNPALRAQIEATAVEKWQPYGEDNDAVKERAQGDYFPEQTAANRYRGPREPWPFGFAKNSEACSPMAAKVEPFSVRERLIVRFASYRRASLFPSRFSSRSSYLTHLRESMGPVRALRMRG